jgi:hypothetical protein
VANYVCLGDAGDCVVAGGTAAVATGGTEVLPPLLLTENFLRNDETENDEPLVLLRGREAPIIGAPPFDGVDCRFGVLLLTVLPTDADENAVADADADGVAEADAEPDAEAEIVAEADADGVALGEYEGMMGWLVDNDTCGVPS